MGTRVLVFVFKEEDHDGVLERAGNCGPHHGRLSGVSFILTYTFSFSEG